MTTQAKQRTAAAVAVLVAALIAVVWLLWPEAARTEKAAEGPPPAQAITAGQQLTPKQCGRQARAPFEPAKLIIPGVVKSADVVGLPRDANDVPSAIPVSEGNAKTAFAWDEPTLKPGSPKGNVLINAHTWPDGSALGNTLLDNLQVGKRMIVRGTNGEELCYKVTKRDVIVAAEGSWEYYEQDGPPQLAIIVCSPPRLGPGNWVHRTIWYASPIGTAEARAAQAS